MESEIKKADKEISLEESKEEEKKEKRTLDIELDELSSPSKRESLLGKRRNKFDIEQFFSEELTKVQSELTIFV